MGMDFPAGKLDAKEASHGNVGPVAVFGLKVLFTGDWNKQKVPVSLVF